MRANSDEGMQLLRRRFEAVVAGTAAAHGCTAEVRPAAAAAALRAPLHVQIGNMVGRQALLTYLSVAAVQTPFPPPYCCCRPCRWLLPPPLPRLLAGRLDGGFDAVLSTHSQRPPGLQVCNGRGRQVGLGQPLLLFLLLPVLPLCNCVLLSRHARVQLSAALARPLHWCTWIHPSLCPCAPTNLLAWLLCLPAPAPAPCPCRMVEEPGLVGETQATMAGEDFSFIGRAVPSCFLFLGIRNETLGSGGGWGPGLWDRAGVMDHARQWERATLAGLCLGRPACATPGVADSVWWLWGIQNTHPPTHPPPALPLLVQCTGCTRRGSRWTRAC